MQSSAGLRGIRVFDVDRRWAPDWRSARDLCAAVLPVHARRAPINSLAGTLIVKGRIPPDAIAAIERGRVVKLGSHALAHPGVTFRRS